MVQSVCRNGTPRGHGRPDAEALEQVRADDLGREHGRGADRHDPVVVAAPDESRDVELLEINAARPSA